MADIRISQLPVAPSPIDGTELVPVVQNGLTVQTTVSAITQSPSLTATFLTVNQQPLLPNSRALSAGVGIGITDGGAQSTYNLSLNGTSGSLETVSTGVIVKSAPNTISARTLTASGNGISVSDGDGVAGNPTFQLTGLAAAIANMSGTGLIGLNSTTLSPLTLIGVTDEISISDGNGAGGNPTIGIADNAVFPGVEGVTLPNGTTAERGSTQGQIRYNTTSSRFEGNYSTGWQQFGTGDGSISSIGGATNQIVVSTIGNAATISIDPDPVIPGVAAIQIPAGTTVQRPGGINGQLRYNSQTALFEGYAGGQWSEIATRDGVTLVETGTGLTGGPITTTGTVSIADTTVTSASYGSATEVPTYTVNAQGQLTAAANVSIAIPSSAITDKGLANGVATLDSGGKVPVSELPAAVLGALSYQGTWNASTNTPTLASGVGDKGYYYVVNVAGSTNLDGITDWLIGDWAVYNGTAWQKVDNTDAVASVNGLTGAVVLTTTNIAEGTNQYFTTARARTSVSAGTGISYNSTTGVITNAAPDQTVSLTGAGTTVVTGTYPSFTITSNDSTTGTVTSVAASAGTGISVTGSPITTSGTINITNTAPDQTVVLTAGTGISTSGTYPNFTITNTSPSLGGNVVGPATATDNAVARFDATTGKLIQNSVVLIGDTGSVTGVNALTAESLVINNNVTLGSSNTDNLAVNARITTDLDPETNNAKDIGTSGRNWRDGFFGRTLHTVNLELTGTTSFDGSQGTSGQVLTSAGTGNTPTWTTPTTGTVTSVTGTAPVVSSGGNTPAISMAAANTTTNGYLTSTDWNTFNNKQAAGTYVTSVSATSPITSSGGVTPTIAIPAATASVNGYLTSTDWNTFNNKTSNTGTVTSVAMTVPTGLSIAGTPITTSGTLALTLTAGYSIPTTSSQTNWDTAFTQRLQWDGGATNLVAATGRTSLGATTVGGNFFTLANPTAITFPRINADNTVSALDAATFRTAIGAGTGSGTVTSVAASVPSFLSVSGSPVTTSGTLAISYSGTALPVANGGTGATTLTGYVKGTGTTAMTASATIPNTDISGLGTMSTQNANSVAVTGGSINGTSLGATTASSAKVTTLDIASGLTLATNAGTSGQVLTSAGAGLVPTWSNPAAAGVSSISFGTTGLTPSTATSGVVSVAGTLAIANGGTGATTNTNARTNLGATTLGSNLFTITNPSAITFPRFNADNTVSALDAATFRTAIGAGTSSTTGTVTSVASGNGMNFTTITGAGTVTMGTPSTLTTATTNATTTTSHTHAITTASANTASTIVARDASGNFSAGTITASLSGNATSATTATTATTATNATNVALTTSATSSAFKVPFANTTVSTTGNYGLLQDSAAEFTYNPSTNTLTVGTFSGSGASLTTLNASNLSSGTVAVARGGTNGSATPTAGTVAYGTGTAYAFTAAGTSGQVLQSNGSGAPTWVTPAGGVTLSNDTSTSTNLYPTFASATSGSVSTIFTGNARLLYKPSTGELQSTVLNASNGIVVNSATVSQSYTIPSGSNAISAGPVTINSGITVTVPSGSVWVIA